MKNLANCEPIEFLKQTNKIRHAVEKWLTITDLLNIRKRLPPVKEGQTAAERKDELQKQARANVSAMLDVILEEHPQETVELLGLMCFVDPEHVNDYPMRDYIESFNELLNDTAVIGFFMSLVKLGQMDISQL